MEKFKIIIILISIIIISFGCDKAYTTTVEIINNSNKKIEFKKYRTYFIDSTSIAISKSDVEVVSDLGGVLIHNMFYDSIKVIFDGTISIMHRRELDTGKEVKRNLLFMDSYTIT